VRKNGEDDIAVKLLHNRLGLDNRQFQNELNNHMMINHPNTVRFVGYCNEAHQVPVEFKGRVVLADKTYRALCFEYLRNGNLKQHLSGMTMLQFNIYVYMMLMKLEEKY